MLVPKRIVRGTLLNLPSLVIIGRVLQSRPYTEQSEKKKNIANIDDKKMKESLVYRNFDKQASKCRNIDFCYRFFS
jgi:hypothetical protein